MYVILWKTSKTIFTTELEKRAEAQYQSNFFTQCVTKFKILNHITHKFFWSWIISNIYLLIPQITTNNLKGRIMNIVIKLTRILVLIFNSIQFQSNNEMLMVWSERFVDTFSLKNHNQRFAHCLKGIGSTECTNAIYWKGFTKILLNWLKTQTYPHRNLW